MLDPDAQDGAALEAMNRAVEALVSEWNRPGPKRYNVLEGLWETSYHASEAVSDMIEPRKNPEPFDAAGNLNPFWYALYKKRYSDTSKRFVAASTLFRTSFLPEAADRVVEQAATDAMEKYGKVWSAFNPPRYPEKIRTEWEACLLYTSPSPRD